MLGMLALEKLCENSHYKEGLPSLVFRVFEQFFRKHMKSERKEEDFGFVFLQKLCKLGRRDKMKVSREHMTLLSMALSSNLITVSVQLGKRGETVLDFSKRSGNMDIYEAIIMWEMGDSLKGSVLKERVRIERLKGFSTSFMDSHGCFKEGSEGYQFMKDMTAFLEGSFEKRLPISEDILFLCFGWNATMHGGNVMKSDLWKCLAKELPSILEIPMKEIGWEWFKANLFHSAVWFLFFLSFNSLPRS